MDLKFVNNLSHSFFLHCFLDLVDIAVEDSSLVVELEASFITTFGAILGGNKDDSLIIITEACSEFEGNNITCPTSALLAHLNYTQNGEDKSANISLPGGKVIDQIVALDGAFGELAHATLEGNGMIALSFSKDIDFIDLKLPKDCADYYNVVQEKERLNCPDGRIPIPLSNSYGLSNAKMTKAPSSLAVGDFAVEVNFRISGTALISCTVLNVVQVSASLESTLVAHLTLRVGAGKIIRFSEWLAALSAFNAPDDENYVPDFLKALVTIDGEFSAVITAAPPFDTLASASATGGFTEPHFLNLLDLENSGSPSIDFEVVLPDLGDITKLSFPQLLDAVVMAMEFLVGPGGDSKGHTLENCAGGLLGQTVLGVDIFNYQLPGKLLKTFFDAVHLSRSN